MRRVILALCWVPVTLYFAASIYVQRFEGWGRWAAAPMFVPALVSSATLGALGAWLLAVAWLRERRFDLALFVGTLLGSSVILVLWARSWI